MPNTLQKYSPSKDGQPICYAFNLEGGCKQTSADGRCPRGLHVCIRCHDRRHGIPQCTLAS
eukprot:1469039-Amphidinium_carterae.1